MKAIILNHMFTGDYLNDNIGHEIINLFVDDSGKNYIYLCSDGRYNRKDIDLPNSYVLQVSRPAHTTGTLQIISVAYGLKLVDEIGEIKYGNQVLPKIFEHNAQKQDRYVTFEAEKVFLPQKTVYIYNDKKDTEEIDCNSANSVYLKDFNPSQTMREYLLEEPGNGNCNYSKLLEKLPLQNTELWKEREKERYKVSTPDYEVSAVDIYGIQTRELSFSNAFKYFIEKYPELFFGFCKYKGCNIEQTEKIAVYREWKNIDILIVTEKHVFVIENKICSGLNGLKGDKTTQLEKYENIISAAVNDKKDTFLSNKKTKYILITPNHNPIETNNDRWEIIYYSKIYDFLSSYIKNAEDKIKEDIYLKDFIKALKNHSTNDYNQVVMLRKFKDVLDKLS